MWYGNASNLQSSTESCAHSWVHLRVSSLCRTSTSNAAKAELLKSSKTQITLESVFSFYCHLASASWAWWQKLRDLGGVFPQAKYFALLIGLCQSCAFMMCDVTCQRPIQRLLHELLPRWLFPRFHSSFFKKRFALRWVMRANEPCRRRRAVESVKCLIGTRNGGRHCNLS